MNKITRFFNKKKSGSDTRTIEEIMETLDVSTACSVLIHEVDRCPTGSGGTFNPPLGHGSYFQEALRSVIPYARRGEARSEVCTHSYIRTYIPPEGLWTGWSRNFQSNYYKAAVEVVADHVFSEQEVEPLEVRGIEADCRPGEPEPLFELSYAAISVTAQKPVSETL